MPHVRISRAACTGCRMCELVCSAFHEPGFRPSAARLRVEVNPTTGEIRGYSCTQTACHKCLDACLKGAIFSEAGVVYVDADKCDGCGDCVKACPFGVIHVDSDLGKAYKCDLCKGGQPQCVAFCQNPHVMAVSLKADRADGDRNHPDLPASSGR